MNLKKRVIELEERLIELEERLIKALQRIQELDEENKKLKKRIEELEGKLNEKKVPHFIKENIKTRKKKNGQKKGHEGCSRKTPEIIDDEEYHKLEECPHCQGHNLSDVQEITERTVTDIPEPQKAVTTKHKKERKYCRDCKKLVEVIVPDALPNSRFGLRLMLKIMFLKYRMRLPFELICEQLYEDHRIEVSRGELPHMLKKLAKYFGSYYEELRTELQKAKVRYIDETGRRVEGKNHQMWGFITETIAYYKIHKSRGHKVPKKVLGKKCKGVNVSDRWTSYYTLNEKLEDCLMQICWTHVLEDSKELAQNFPEGKIIHRRLKRIFNDSNKLKGGKGTEKDIQRFLKRMDKIKQLQFKSPTCYKFIKNLCTRDREHLFVFVTHEGVEPTNNHAERGLRSDVVIRKISGGNRSKQGARIHECLLSTMMTYKLQKKNLMRDGLNYIQTNLMNSKLNNPLHPP